MIKCLFLILTTGMLLVATLVCAQDKIAVATNEDHIRIRSWPSTQDPTIGLLPKGAQLTVVAARWRYEEIGSHSDLWYLVDFSTTGIEHSKQRLGWVFGQFLSTQDGQKLSKVTSYSADPSKRDGLIALYKDGKPGIVMIDPTGKAVHSYQTMDTQELFDVSIESR